VADYERDSKKRFANTRVLHENLRITMSEMRAVGPEKTMEQIRLEAEAEAAAKEADKAELDAARNLLRVYNEGRDAFLMKKKAVDNPYPIHTRKGLVWMFGFDLSAARDGMRHLAMDGAYMRTLYEQESKRWAECDSKSKTFCVKVAVPDSVFSLAK
jgi:hypothetical protein